MRTTNHGYTLLELMIVASIITLLTVIAVPSFLNYQTKARLMLCKNNLRLLGYAAEQFFLENNLSIRTVTPEEVEPYIKGGIPECPEGVNYEFHEGSFHCGRHAISYNITTGQIQ